MAFFGGTLGATYNGFTFNERTQTVAFSAKPKYDSSNRTVVYVVYSITLRTTIIGTGTTCDTEILDARRRLLVPGKAFAFSNNGSGGLSINVNNNSTDVVWGPRPQELSYRPIGVKAAEIEWKVEVAIPECSAAVTKGALMEFNYRLGVDQDRAGYSTRTYRGYYSIPLTRNLDGSRSLSDSADNYWEDILPDIPDNFRREIVSRELDESKARMDFTVVDTELGPNFLPEGIVECKASHVLDSTDRGFAGWMGTISAEYECARDFAPEKCYPLFVDLCKKRMDYMKKNGKPLEGQSYNGKAVNGIVLPTKLSLAEPDIYGRPMARFSLQYMFVQNVSNLLKSCGIWLPVENDWKKWKTSLENTAFHPRGNAKLKFNPNDDVIVDLCLGIQSVTLRTPQAVKPAQHTLTTKDFAGPCPGESDSWIMYDFQIQSETDDCVVVHKIMPQKKPANATQGYIPKVSAPSDIVQRRTSNSDVVYLVGSALRACYDIPPPRLEKIGDRPATSANRGDQEYFRAGLLGTFGHKVYWAQWKLRYIIASREGDSPILNSVPRNPGSPTLTTGGGNAPGNGKSATLQTF